MKAKTEAEANNDGEDDGPVARISEIVAYSFCNHQLTRIKHEQSLASRNLESSSESLRNTGRQPGSVGPKHQRCMAELQRGQWLEGVKLSFPRLYRHQRPWPNTAQSRSRTHYLLHI
jgi:hypothetical protein